MYRLIGDGDFNNPMKTIFKNRGITEDLFNLDESVVEDYNNYDNMIKGVELLVSHLDKGSKILFVVDSDMDGFSSFSILYNYIKEVYPGANLVYKQHTGKQHGLSDITVEDDVDLVVVADAGTNDFANHKELKERGIDVLVIDHHKGEEFSKDAVVINNQLSEKVKNKNLSGAGVCYKFITALDDYIGESVAHKFIDLACIGNVADVMDLHEKETRYYVYEGLKKTNNLFLQALKEVKEYDLDGKYDIEKIGWTIAPIINGCIRSGTVAEKSNMVKAFISDDYDFCLKVASACKNVKARQDRSVKNSLEKIEKDIELKPGDKCIILNTEKTLSSAFRGLVAQKISSKYGVPTMLYSEAGEGSVGGSFRGSELSSTFRTDILKSGLVEMAQG